MTAATLTADAGMFEVRKKKKGFVSYAFQKVANMACRGAVTGTLKFVAVTTLVGAGASSLLTIGATAAASGIGCALYVYGKDYALAKWRGEEFDFRDKARLKKAKLAFLAGVAGGALGSWLAGTEFFQAGMESLKHLGGQLLDAFIPAASAAPVPQLPVMAAAQAAALPNISAPQPQSVMNKLWSTAMHSKSPAAKAIANMLGGVETPAVTSVSPQYLKDCAHEVLRMKDIAWEERVTLARQLAQIAKERGNKQAGKFLEDLLQLQINAEPIEKVVVAATRLPPLEQAAEAAFKPAIHDVVNIDSVVAAIAPPVVEIDDISEFLSQDFREAAVCRVSAPDAEGFFNTSCETLKEEMQPGDYVTFVSEENPFAREMTPLTADSVAVRTQDFLHEAVVADGVDKVNKAGVRLVMAAAF